MVDGPRTTILGDKYAVVRVLGHGGMGSVFEVEHLVTKKRAALKRLHQHFDAVDDAESKRRVVHEARAMARIQHRHVVDVYDVFEDAGRVCLVMELLQGQLLSERISQGGIALSSYVGWLLGAMRGVAAAHAAGVTHRDVKPENIFLTTHRDDGEVVPVVIDFGVSKLHATECEPRPDGATRSGVAMGTPRYVSYEQLRGLRDVDGRTDVYAFGVMLYEALVGVPPYDAATFPEQAVCFLTTEPARVCARRPLVPEALGALVESALSRDRAHRPQTMAAFVEALAPFAAAASYEAPLDAFPLAARGTEAGAVGRAGAVAQPAGARPAPPLHALIAEAPRLPSLHPQPVPLAEPPRGAGSYALGAALALGVGALVAWAARDAGAAAPRPRLADLSQAAPGVLPALAKRALLRPAPAASLLAPRPVAEPEAAQGPQPARVRAAAAKLATRPVATPAVEAEDGAPTASEAVPPRSGAEVVPAFATPLVAEPPAPDLPSPEPTSPAPSAPRAGPMARHEF